MSRDGRRPVLVENEYPSLLFAIDDEIPYEDRGNKSFSYLRTISARIHLPYCPELRSPWVLT